MYDTCSGYTEDKGTTDKNVQEKEDLLIFYTICEEAMNGDNFEYQKNQEK